MWLVAGALSILSLILVAVQLFEKLSGSKTVISISPPNVEPLGPPLPERSPKEVEHLVQSLPCEWVTYEGCTPPLRLKVRGQTYETYRRMVRAHIDGIGQHYFESLDSAQQTDIFNLIIADIYVTAWEGAQYQNGNPLPFTPENLRILFQRDPLLLNFVIDNARRISPPWPKE